MGANTTQPIFCCLGDNVAGDPSQYVFDRLFADANLDWKTLTVEIEKQHFIEGLNGVRAMRFDGVRLLPSLSQFAVGSFLGNPQLEFIGEVSSAMVTQQGWSAWHALGRGLVQELQLGLDWQLARLVLLGNSVLSRSVAVACEGCVPQSFHWIQGPDLAGGPLSPELSGRITRLEGPLEKSDDRPQALDIGATVIVGDDRNDLVHLAQVATREQNPVHVITGSTFAKADLPDHVQVHGPVEQFVYSNAFDFEQWTGQAANRVMIREAYEEYLDF